MKRIILGFIGVMALLIGLGIESPAASTMTVAQSGATPTPDRIATLLAKQQSAATATVTIAATQPPIPAEIAWLSQSTMYSLFVRSFRDSNGDGVGDLQGVIDGLDYLQGLGVDTIWLLPVFRAASYHGYDTTDYFEIQPEYGTKADLLALIQAAHGRGMKIILDYVVNHVSNQHPYFKAALGDPANEYAEYFEWSNVDHTSYKGFAGLKFMPTLNFGSAKVRDYVQRVALYWLDPNQDGDPSDGIDGWRADVALEIPHDYWQQLRMAMAGKNPRAILLAELFTGDAYEISKYLKGDEFHAAFDFPNAMRIAGDFEKTGDGLASGQGSPELLGTLLRAERAIIDPRAVLVRFINNHDTDRIASEVRGDLGRLKAAAIWLMTAPPVPILYYGEEIGMRGVKGKGPDAYDEYRREPLDWYRTEVGPQMTTWFLPVDRNNRANDGISVEEQDGDPASLLNLYRSLGRLRNSTAAMRSGQYDTPKLESPLYLVRHWDAQTLIVAAVNFTDQPLVLNLAQAIPPESNFSGAPTLLFRGDELDALRSVEGGVQIAAGRYVVLRWTR